MPHKAVLYISLTINKKSLLLLDYSAVKRVHVLEEHDTLSIPHLHTHFRTQIHLVTTQIHHRLMVLDPSVSGRKLPGENVALVLGVQNGRKLARFPTIV